MSVPRIAADRAIASVVKAVCAAYWDTPFVVSALVRVGVDKAKKSKNPAAPRLLRAAIREMYKSGTGIDPASTPQARRDFKKWMEHSLTDGIMMRSPETADSISGLARSDAFEATSETIV